MQLAIPSRTPKGHKVTALSTSISIMPTSAVSQTIVQCRKLGTVNDYEDLVGHKNKQEQLQRYYSPGSNGGHDWQGVETQYPQT